MEKKINTFAVGNQVVAEDGTFMTITPPLLSLYELWQKQTLGIGRPFMGIRINNLTLAACGFRLAKIRPEDDEDFSLDYEFEYIAEFDGYTDIHVDADWSYEQGGTVLGFKDGRWYILDERLNSYESKYFCSVSRGLDYIHELQNAAYWLCCDPVVFKTDSNADTEKK